MNWQTLHRLPQPEDFEPGAKTRSALTHVRVEGDTASLCGAVDVTDGDWCDGGDEHPEDIDSLDRCSVCWSVFERRRREEAGREAIPSQHLSWTRGRQVAA